MHGDFNEQNIIVTPSPLDPTEHVMHGLIDFGDIHNGPYLFELGITLCYMMLECLKGKDIDPLEGSGYTLAGYMSKREIPPLEFELLRVKLQTWNNLNTRSILNLTKVLRLSFSDMHCSPIVSKPCNGGLFLRTRSWEWIFTHNGRSGLGTPQAPLEWNYEWRIT